MHAREPTGTAIPVCTSGTHTGPCEGVSVQFQLTAWTNEAVLPGARVDVNGAPVSRRGRGRGICSLSSAGGLPPAGLEPATCALRRRLVYGLGERIARSEFRCTICLVNHAAKQGPPPTLGSGWDRKVSGRRPRIVLRAASGWQLPGLTSTRQLRAAFHLPGAVGTLQHLKRH